MKAQAIFGAAQICSVFYASVSLCSRSPLKLASGRAEQSCTSRSLCQLRVLNLQKLSWEGAPPVLCRTSPHWCSLCSWKQPPAWSSLCCLHGWCHVFPVCTHPTQDGFQAPLEGHPGMWQEGNSAESLIWIARGAGLQNAPVSTSHKVQMQPRWLRVFITALMEKLEGM